MLQRCGAKVVNSIKQALLSTTNTKDYEKFNGSLETTHSLAQNKIDKATLIKLLRKEKRLHLEQLLHLIEYMRYICLLLDTYHVFTTEQVLWYVVFSLLIHLLIVKRDFS